MENLKSFITSTTEPKFDSPLDPGVKKSLWKRNQANFRALLLTSLFFTITYPLSNSSGIYAISVLFNTGVFFLFLFLCRSYIQSFNIIITIAVSFAGYVFMDLTDDFTYIYLGYCYSMIPYVMMVHGNTKYAAITGGAQVIVMQFKFKPSLEKMIASTSPQEFSQKFTEGMEVHYAATLVVLLYLLRLLEKRTKELEVAQKATEEALEQQRTFIFSFSHELRNPINSLLGNLQLVLMGGMSATIAKEMINTAKICGEILLQAINNVLDTGKYEMGKLEVNPVPTRIYELFQRSWTIYQELFRQKKLKSCLKIEKSIYAMVKIDAIKVNQIILNLIGNAIKFTEKGNVNLTIKWIEKEKVDEECFEPQPYDETDEGIFEKDEKMSFINNQYQESFISERSLGEGTRMYNVDELVYPRSDVKGVLKIIVQDTGCGMKKEDLEKLFRKFSQVSEDVSRRQIGTGLGLFISKEICRALKGDIRAYSKPMIGTTIVVCIPVMAMASSTVSDQRDCIAMISLLKLRNLNAIVADDSPFNVKLICNYFAELGTNVVSAAYNGEEAYMKYKEDCTSGIPVDVITLDIDMPRLNGKQVCDKIRKYEKENKLQPAVIIFISGNYDKDQMVDYLDKTDGSGADCFLKKPVAFEDFTTAVFSLMMRH